MNNTLKARLKKGERVLGTMVSLFDHPEIAKIIKLCGFDYFIVDCEHGNFDYTSVARIMTVARECGICGMVRIPDVKREFVLKYMDMGAGGLLLPNTETVEQARALVEFAKYAPLGNRGVQLFRGHTGFEKIVSPVEYMKKANQYAREIFNQRPAKNTAIGVAGMKKVLLQAYNAVVKDKIIPFDTKEEALDYLAK